MASIFSSCGALGTTALQHGAPSPSRQLCRCANEGRPAQPFCIAKIHCRGLFSRSSVARLESRGPTEGPGVPRVVACSRHGPSQGWRCCSPPALLFGLICRSAFLAIHPFLRHTNAPPISAAPLQVGRGETLLKGLSPSLHPAELCRESPQPL